MPDSSFWIDYFVIVGYPEI